MNILGCELVMTCGACPEQYDVYLDNKQVGYLRLRHGIFRAHYKDCAGENIYTATPQGDGIFEDDEREYYLTNAILSLLTHHDKLEIFNKNKLENFKASTRLEE